MILNHDDSFIHVVKNGETLHQIAEHYKMPLVELILANMDIYDPSCLSPGQLLRIPSELLKKRFETIKAVLETCKALVNTPYKNEQSDEKECFCSRYIQSAYHKNGVHLPSTSALQSNQGVEIPMDVMDLGDLLFFTTRARSKKYSSYQSEFIGHTAIYLGKNKIFHPSPHNRNTTMVSELSEYYKGVFVVAKRVILHETSWDKKQEVS